MKEDIYKITCLKTNKIYIGRTRKKLSVRLKNHYSDAKNDPATYQRPLHIALRYYGIENFIIEKIGEIEGKDLYELNIKEQEYIKSNNAFYPNGYNVCGLWGIELKRCRKELKDNLFKKGISYAI